ncbi:MAG: DUF4397 domain-containing protein [Gammaproteobacteria bacterium]
MKKYRNWSVLLAAVSLGVTACGGSSNNNNSTPVPVVETTALRVVHAVADAPAVNVNVDGAEVLSAVPFRAGSAFLELDEGAYDISVDAIVPPDQTVTVIDVAGLQLDSSSEYNVLAVGKTADGTIEPLVIAADPFDASIGQVRLVVAHASPSAPQVDVYLTAAGDVLDPATNRAASFSFTESFSASVPPAEYQIRITLPDDPSTVVFDSGPGDLAGGDYLVAAVDNTGPGASPVSLVIVDRDGESANLLDIATPAIVTAVHDSPDAPTVDILADDRTTPTNEAIKLVDSLPFTEFDYLSAVPPGSYTLTVTPEDNPSVEALSLDADLLAGDEVTGIVTGFLANPPSEDLGLQALVLGDDTRSIATEARVRIVHGSPSTPEVDIYVTAPGAVIGDPDVDPAFSSVPFGADTGFVSLAAGSYDITVTLAGDTTPAIFVPGLAVNGGDVLTAIARDPNATAGETALGLIVIDYNAAKAGGAL